MSVTFGANSDRYNVTLSGAQFNGLYTVTLVTGWWYPTTLTAGRGFWAANNVLTPTIGSTTSQISLVTNCGVDGNYTADAGIVTDKWQFIAFLFTRGANAAAETWKVWVGDETTVPVSKTITTNTVAAGGITASTVWVVGNTAATVGSPSFQGSVSQVSLLQSRFEAVHEYSLWGISTLGAVTSDEENFILNRFVIPMYYGQTPRFINDTSVSSTVNASSWALFSALETNGLQTRLSSYQAGGNYTANLAWSFTGTSFSQAEPALRQTSFAWPQGGARLTRRRP